MIRSMLALPEGRVGENDTIVSQVALRLSKYSPFKINITIIASTGQVSPSETAADYFTV